MAEVLIVALVLGFCVAICVGVISQSPPRPAPAIICPETDIDAVVRQTEKDMFRDMADSTLGNPSLTVREYILTKGER